MQLISVFIYTSNVFLFLGDFVFLQIRHVYLFSFVSSLCLNGFSFAWIIEYSDQEIPFGELNPLSPYK